MDVKDIVNQTFSATVSETAQNSGKWFWHIDFIGRTDKGHTKHRDWESQKNIYSPYVAVALAKSVAGQIAARSVKHLNLTPNDIARHLSVHVKTR